MASKLSTIQDHCPLEKSIARALEAAGIQYRYDHNGEVPEHLDFYLPKYDIFIEAKGGHTPRIAKQTARAQNVIVVQGMKSVTFLSKLLENYKAT